MSLQSLNVIDRSAFWRKAGHPAEGQHVPVRSGTGDDEVRGMMSGPIILTQHDDAAELEASGYQLKGTA